MAKVALLIGVSEYEPGLNPLPGSVLDVDAMQRVLCHSEMGGFAESNVTVLKNPQRQEMEDEIYRLFADRKKDDLLLLYFSGHGIKDENGRLYLATRTTRKEQGRLVNPSAVAASYLHDRINDSRSQRQVVILDCCFSGAIAQGMTIKDDGNVDLQASLGGRGRAILTSSTSVEYSLSADGSSYADGGLSVYTRYLVEGIETGTADIDGDGFISAEELHEYASNQVREAAPTMTPKFYPVEEGYKIFLANSPKDDPKLKFRKEVQARAKQGQGKFSVFARQILEGKRREWGISPEEAEAIKTEVLQPYRDYEQKCQDYEQALMEAANLEYPFSAQTETDLQEYRQYLSLRSEDWEAIEARVLAPFKQQLRVTQPERDTTATEPVTPQPPPTTTQISQTAEQFFEHGLEKYNAGDYQGAIADYTEAIRLQPDYAAAYYSRGLAKSDLGNKQGAIADYTEAIQINKNWGGFNSGYHGLPTAYNNRGIAKSALGDKQGAIADYTEAIGLKPDYADAYYNRGIAKSDLGNKQGWMADYREAARLYQQQGKTENYRSALNQIEELEKKDK